MFLKTCCRNGIQYFSINLFLINVEIDNSIEMRVQLHVNIKSHVMNDIQRFKV